VTKVQHRQGVQNASTCERKGRQDIATRAEMHWGQIIRNPHGDYLWGRRLTVHWKKKVSDLLNWEHILCYLVRD
jgi:hypothetical protein